MWVFTVFQWNTLMFYFDVLISTINNNDDDDDFDENDNITIETFYQSNEYVYM